MSFCQNSYWECDWCLSRKPGTASDWEGMGWTRISGEILCDTCDQKRWEAIEAAVGAVKAERQAWGRNR